MGSACGDLIMPAILYMNPGKTKEELSELIDEVEASPLTEFKDSDPWDIHHREYIDYLHLGLDGVAHLLKLSESKKEFKIDENGFKIAPPEYKLFFDPPKAVVTIHEKNIIKKPKRIKRGYSKLIKVGDIFKNEWDHPREKRGIVTKIYSEEFDEPSRDTDKKPYCIYDVEVKPIITKFRKEEFNSEQELWKKWPQLHPNNSFDWSKEKGKFGSVGEGDYLSDFSWKMNNGRYFLDEELFNIMPASKLCESLQIGEDKMWGYTNLILTAEAIKNKAWKLISYKATFNDKFLRDFPSAKEAYDKAVWDSHTSLHAKQNNMNISDFLRWRISPKK